MSLESPAPTVSTAPAPARTPRWRGAFASLVIGLGGALFGLLPWLLTGMRLPLQPMWVADVLPEQMPIAFLPLGHASITNVLGMLVVGSAAVGLAARLLADRLPSGAPFSVAAGLLLVQIVAVAQSAEVLQRGLRADDRGFYLVACVAVAVVGIGVGLVAFVLLVASPRAGAMLGAVAGALALDWWLDTFFAPRGVLPIELYSGFDTVLRWVPAVLVGVAIAWAGVRTVGRIVAAVVSLFLLWLVPAAAAAVTAAVGSRVMLRLGAELLDYAAGVWKLAAFMPSLVLPPLVVAVVVAALGITVRELLARRSAVAGAAQPAEEAASSG